MIEKISISKISYGLSYTKFVNGEPKLSKKNTLDKNHKVTVSVKLTNVGKFEGEEIVQLYIRDQISSATSPVKELKGYKRVLLKVGETKTVDFTIGGEGLAFYDRKFLSTQRFKINYFKSNRTN